MWPLLAFFPACWTLVPSSHMNHNGDFAIRQFLSLLPPCCVDNALMVMVRISSHYMSFPKDQLCEQ